MKTKHLVYCPFTGLGLYNGFRGNRWLKNRIKIFKQFVVPSLLSQTNDNFILWISWRREERNNPIVLQLIKYLDDIFSENQVIHTFAGVCFYDDKYNDDEARERLLDSIHQSMPTLLNALGECDYILMTIQPSDDIYESCAFDKIQHVFEKEKSIQALGYTQGYICNYFTKVVAEYNPTTNPPFYTIKFPREVFQDPLSHLQYTSLKVNIGKYKQGTPLPSHEYVGNCLKYRTLNGRGFMVGTHSENISTVFNHPFKGKEIAWPEDQSLLKDFGISQTTPLILKTSLRKRILKALPFDVQKRLRYLFGEKIWNYWYNFLRS